MIKYIKLIKKTLIIFSVSFLPVFFNSCINEEVCEEVASVPIRIGFYLDDLDEEEPVPIAIDSITVYGLAMDSLIYDSQNNVGRMELPLHPGTDSVAFVFRIPPIPGTLQFPGDTIWFLYERKPNLISMECGFVTFYELKEVKHSRNLIDQILIEETSIINNLDEHIKIFPFISTDDDNDDR